MRLLLFCFLFVTIAGARNLTPAWLELGPDGRNVARVVVEAGDACPVLIADGGQLATERRIPVPQGFQPVCEAAIPPNTASLTFGDQKLTLPRTPDTVAVFGDTGCRVTKTQLQACNDPMAWPFLRNMRTIAKARPDLIVHVGDYLYREDACPDRAKGCAGPHGDNWPTWKADFFDPAAPALAAAPWVFTRGNHESCQRSWRGWFYYLDPRPFDGRCTEQSDAWIAQSGMLRIGVMDSALIANRDTAAAPYVPRMARQLSRLSHHADWISVHHPFWAYLPGAMPTAPLAAAWEKSHPAGIRLILSGHIHLFEFLGFGSGHPSQLVAGTGGTRLLDVPIQQHLAGETVFGAPVNSGESRHEFGHTELHRGKQGAAGWTLDLMELDGSKALSCRLPDQGNPQCAQ
jgi:hypothetical protein